MAASILLITPPFTQLNTPYPATAYLKGFLNTIGVSSYHCDLGIETTLAIFCKTGLTRVFEAAQNNEASHNDNILRILAHRDKYVSSIDAVIAFLQGKDPTLAHRITRRNFLPEAARFKQLDDLVWAFGSMGVQDKAKHLATMYLEDLSDLIATCVDENFGFSRYAERLGRSANSFDELYGALKAPMTFTDDILLEILEEKLQYCHPQLVAFSVPFPGNLYTAFRCASYIQQHHPGIFVTMGGGFANTELRSLSDIRVFEFFNAITLDDGEAPMQQLHKYVNNEIAEDELKRTFLKRDNQVVYINNSACADYKQGQVGTPDYSDLLLDKYISAIEVANPMHSMWSDGRWNKLTMAHGCYWGKCTFCDTSLDYIQRYEPLTAVILCDRMEELIAQTGNTGFHFVDEAAPPALMRSLALEILRRKLVVSWWANVRFEKSFTRDLCILLKASGCIAVSGGLEVASDRLLQLIQKGITVAQVARVNKNFTDAGIMVHAYLMYGYPTQTAQETIDSMEMVRQMFQLGIMQSGFWHRFALTVHSPVGKEPDKYKIKITSTAEGAFANNDLLYEENNGIDHEQFSYGLKKSLFNYMHSACLDYPLQKWFDHKVPKTTIPPDYIQKSLDELAYQPAKPTARVVFIGESPTFSVITKSKKGSQWEVGQLTFYTATDTVIAQMTVEQAKWLMGILPKLAAENLQLLTLQQLQEEYEKQGLDDFELFWDNKPINILYKAGLLVV